MEIAKTTPVIRSNCGLGHDSSADNAGSFESQLRCHTFLANGLSRSRNQFLRTKKRAPKRPFFPTVRARPEMIGLEVVTALVVQREIETFFFLLRRHA